MRNVKNLCICVLALLMVSGALYAGGSGESGAAQKKVINVASVMPKGAPADLALDLFKEDLEKTSNGRFEVLIHVGSAMGGERETFEMLEGGSAEVGLLGTADIAAVYPKLACTESPFLFRDVNHFWKYWDGPGKELNDRMEKEHGVRTIGIVLRGARYLTAHKPIRNIQDLKGIKLRLPEVQVVHDFWKAAGALTTTIAFSEVYMGLKTGVVDAQENPPESIESYKMYEVQKYLMTTRHIFSANRYLLSMKWYNTLSKEEQQAFDASMKKCVDYAKKLTDAGDDSFVKRLVENGMEVIEIDNSGFQKIAESFYPDYGSKSWEAGLYERIRNL